MSFSSSRKKSCQECRAAKARCDLLTPSCTRCLERRKLCLYERSQVPLRSGARRARRAQSIGVAVASPSPLEAVATTGLNQQEVQPVSNTSDADFDALDILNEGDWLADNANCSISPSLLDLWSTSGSDLSTDWSMPSTLQPEAAISTSGIAGVYQKPSKDMPFGISHRKQYRHQLGPMPNQNLTTASMTNMMLNSRSDHAIESTLTISTLLGKVSRFPRMLIEGAHLPPFIHARCATRGLSEPHSMHQVRTQLLEPLAICSSITHMLVNKTLHSGKFIARTIQAEQLRLLHEHAHLDNDTLLAALQALVTYLILQAMDAETWTQPGTLCAGIQAIFEISRKLQRVGDNGFTAAPAPATTRAQAPSWEEWAFFESHRRTVNLLYLLQHSLNYLTSLYSAMSLSCAGYDAVPLPCAQSLWAADARADWEREYRGRDWETEDASVLKIGVISRSLLEFGQDTSEFQVLRRWCSELDDLGTLVWTAARVRSC